MTLIEFINLPENKGTRRQDWAKRLGLSNSYLSEILNGHKRPGVDVIERIAVETSGQVPPSAWFVNFTPDPSEAAA